MPRNLTPMQAPQITAIFNNSIRDICVSPLWKSASICPYERRLIEKDITQISVIQPLSRERTGACRGKMAVRGDRTQNRPKFGNRGQVSTTNMLVDFTICLKRLMAVIWLTQSSSILLRPLLSSITPLGLIDMTTNRLIHASGNG